MQRRVGSAPGKRTRSQQLVQASGNPTALPAEAVHPVAEQGIAGGGGPLPFADTIQASFGRHDVSQVRAHVGGAAADASQALGAEAYASGSDVAFAGAPDLHTAAHEAAHVVQQRGGVQLKGGVGEAGDQYEQHAEAVADRVVAGQSAEDLLDPVAGDGAGASGGVQRKAIQFWSGHEHRAMGNMAAIMATGNIPFDKYVENFKAKLAPGCFITPKDAAKEGGKQGFEGAESTSFTGGVHQSKDPALRELERQGSQVKKARVRTNDTYVNDPYGYDAHPIHHDISFGAASEFGGDFSANPKELARATSSGNPAGNDKYKMATLAMTNINHFYPLNNKEYQTHHKLALQAAAAKDGSTAMLEEGFASHFLEDSFAAGHMAPRGLDKTSKSSQSVGKLGLNRTKSWHDQLNEVKDAAGLPTNMGGFHGDDTMTANDLTAVATEVAKSLKHVLDTLADPAKAKGQPVNLPVPSYSKIMATKRPHEDPKEPSYGTVWARMLTDYEEDLRDAENPELTGRPDSVTTDGGSSMGTKEMAAKMRAALYGGQTQNLLRLGNTEWNGDILVFNLHVIDKDGKRDAPADTVVWVQWFDCDMGYDRNELGRETGYYAADSKVAFFRDDDEKIGGLRAVRLTEAGIGSARAAEDDTNDSYAVFYTDKSAQVPIGRSKVQGHRKGRVKKPVRAHGFDWSGKTLSFRVTQNGQAVNGRTVYLRWYDKDSGFDRDSSGNKDQTILDSDPQVGDSRALKVVDGKVSLTARGKANNPKDTYATVYLDPFCTIPIGRSPVQPGKWYQW